MRRGSLYAALALYLFGSIPASGVERSGQWVLESQPDGIVAFKIRPSSSFNDRSAAAELAFICNQESQYVVTILAPNPETFKNEQEWIPVAIRKSEDGYDPSDLLQRWENEGEYIFSENPSEQEDLTSYLKDKESESVKSVHFYFPNDLKAGIRATNHVVIDLSGFSSGLEAFKKQCEHLP